MTRFDFDSITPRKGTNCVKWDAEAPVRPGKDVIPMWVADMDFQAAPFIREALQKRLDHGVFGYTVVPQGWYDCVASWFGRRHGWKIDPSWIQYTTGVVPGISAVIKALTSPGDKVIIQTPVYNCFFSSIRNNGCIAAESPLRICGGPRYEMDFESFERVCADPAAKIFLLCNPHNPAGRVWTLEELEKAGEICRRHGVIVVSDEIHCEIVRPGLSYVPMGSVDQSNTISLVSPSKSFNIAGLQMAAIVSDNPDWRKRIDKAININEICDVNPFGPVGVEAAYSKEGAQWLDELNAYIWANYDLMKAKLQPLADAFPVFELEGTYLAWIDCRGLGIPSADIENSLLENEGVWINAGTMYGCDGFIRVNLAAPRSLVSEGLDRLVCGLKRLKTSTTDRIAHESGR